MTIRATALALATAAWLAVVPGVLAGTPILDRFHDSFDFTVDDFNACGTTVTAHFVGRAVFIVRADDPNLDRVQIVEHFEFTYSNLANGREMTLVLDLNTPDLLVTENGDGTITETYAATGRSAFVDGDGRIFLMSSGRIVYADTINLNGTPDDGSDDYLQSFEILQIAGPHPGAEGGNFCRAVDALLA